KLRRSDIGWNMPPLRGWWGCGSGGFYKDSAPTERALSGPAPEGRHLCSSESKRTQKLRRSDIGWDMPPLRGWWCCRSFGFYKDSAPTELALSGPHQNHFLISAPEGRHLCSSESKRTQKLRRSDIGWAMPRPQWGWRCG